MSPEFILNLFPYIYILPLILASSGFYLIHREKHFGFAMIPISLVILVILMTMYNLTEYQKAPSSWFRHLPSRELFLMEHSAYENQKPLTIKSFNRLQDKYLREKELQ